MNEAEVVSQLVQQTEILLEGVAVFFTIISVYLAGLNFVLSEESILTRIIAFAFVTLSLAMLGVVIVGAQSQHGGLIARLQELDTEGALTAAGRAALRNADTGIVYGPGILTIDEAVLYLLWGAGGLIYIALVHLTFIYRWRPSASAAFSLPQASHR